MGPMFRYERPQKGRYRQFHQIDVEALGYPGPGRRCRADPDVGAALAAARPARTCGCKLNSLGTPRIAAPCIARSWPSTSGARRARSTTDSRRRLEGNPLRILDSKNPGDGSRDRGARRRSRTTSTRSRRQHFATLLRHLDAAGVDYRVNPRLVRGLDYYSRTVFEWVTTDLGSQDAVCSGGRYDGLVEQLGGDADAGHRLGAGAGAHRRADAPAAAGPATRARADVYLVLAGAAAEARGLALAEQLRDAAPGLRIETQLRRRRLQVADEARRPQRRPVRA